ncbi:hydrogenase large subunit [Ramlibacter sp. AN1133]|uniref:hydrogenase large subunit n=1 Tax=Ramlibacter sp. AN1133 TaxID=3133429 RepID=UPI0030C62C49
MGITRLNLPFARLPAPLPVWRIRVERDQWLAAAGSVAQSGGRLVALWGADRGEALAVCAAYAAETGLYWVDLALEPQAPHYPDIAHLFPCASRMQRATFDLLGIAAEGAQDRRPWLNHGAWPAEYHPLRKDAGAVAPQPLQDYPFVRVEGDGVHEIPVGPVHAGIIEPGHFRFSVVGEKVLRLEERLGYTHKGIERRFLDLPALEGHRLAGRVSGDSTVAFAWAYCMALESALGCVVPSRAAWLRALLLERERVSNHLNDLGFLGNDAALGFGLAQFSRLREDWLRLSNEAFGHRMMMDRVVPGGVAVDLDDALRERLRRQCDAIEAQVRTLEGIYESHAGLQDRFATTGIVSHDLALQLGLTGLAARASGQAMDLRCDQPWVPYEGLQVQRAGHRNGDVAARVAVRFQETLESLRLLRLLCDSLPDGPVRVPLAAPTGEGVGAGWVEGWRGEVLVALELGPGGAVRRCHCHDPSWQNWPVLEHAVIGNIVPDFPLINKSFNLSYSGHDL